MFYVIKNQIKQLKVLEKFILKGSQILQNHSPYPLLCI